MRVYNRTEFLKLPAGTIYAKGVQWAFDGLCIKTDSGSAGSGNDWYYRNPCWVAGSDAGDAVDRLDHALETGTSIPGQDAEGRDGCFEPDAVFLVFEEADLLILQQELVVALDVARKTSVTAVMEIKP